jgi:predicted CXXCH cytochrome family protein
MTNAVSLNKWHRWILLISTLVLIVVFGIIFSSKSVAMAAQVDKAREQDAGYVGSEACAKCHDDIHLNWELTRHAKAFSSPIFQRDWIELSSDVTCLACHTTGFNPLTGEYVEEGVSCESCHGPFQPTHPGTLMPITPDAELCATCHKTTTNEWYASVHSEQGIQCQSCHNPHSQTPMADSITELCSNCHKERGGSFTHGTHANAGLECSNCHMYTSPRTGDPIEGLVPTGHIFSVGSETCIGCHQDTVHTRDEILRLTSGVTPQVELDTESLQKQIQEQEVAIDNLETTASVRLYTGLAQGAIIGIITGGAIAWVVSKRIEYVEASDEDQEEESGEDE